MHQYSIHIYWHETDEIFVATVPELVECSASGATHEEALQAVHQAVEAWIESAKNARHPLPAPQGHPTEQTGKGRGGRRQERIEQRRLKREKGRHDRRQSS